MVDEFCNSHFSFIEKRKIFFPEHHIVCRTCHKPRVKRLINLEDFSLRHQHGGFHDIGAPPTAIINPPAGAAIIPLDGDPPGDPHINPLYVTRNEFNNFRALVNQNMQQLQNRMNQLQNQVNQVDQNMQQLQNQVNQIDQNMQQFQNQMDQNIVGILATLGNINNNIARLNQRLGIQ